MKVPVGWVATDVNNSDTNIQRVEEQGGMGLQEEEEKK
jgi:hypothetical protein